jgi:hypothetical protein
MDIIGISAFYHDSAAAPFEECPTLKHLNREENHALLSALIKIIIICDRIV